MPIVDSTRRNNIGLFFCGVVFIIAIVLYLWDLNSLPLVDYDEATYAQVSDHTLDSGDVLTLRRYGQPWFEKPPLYFWMTGATTSIFGRHEYAYRLPSVVMAIFALVFLWLIVQRLSGDALCASLATLVLLSWPFYYLAARQARLDIPVIAMILASLAALVYGWRKQQWLIAVVPAIALGFMLKSFIALLALPVLAVFSIVYGEWRWLRSRFLWYGVALALLIAVPWHAYQIAQWGSEFVSSYFGYHIFERATGGIGQSAGFQLFAYIRQLWHYGQPWVVMTLGAAIAYTTLRVLRKQPTDRDRLLEAAFLTTFGIVLLFGLARTRILTYLLPAFPFAAIVIASATAALMRAFRNRIVLLTLTVLFIAGFGYSAALGSGSDPRIMSSMYSEWVPTQKAIGEIVRDSVMPGSHFYVMEWPMHETLRYYSDTELEFVGFPPPDGFVLRAPWFLMLTNLHIPLFMDSNGTVREEYKHIEIRYASEGGQVFLFYGAEDITF
ncbi:MAG: glycosyltransferase family 39 protein [Patescibacteria group bacterium]